MNRLDVEKFKLLLMEELVLEYNMTELEAQKVIAKSTINNSNFPHKIRV